MRELEALLASIGLGPRDVLARRSRVFRSNPEMYESMSDEELLHAMVEEPSLVRRPLTVRNEGYVVGFDQAGLQGLVEQQEKQG